MRKVSKPIKMLAEFSVEGNAPLPRKFKWVDGRGFQETVIVDEVVAIDVSATLYILYDCISYYENSFRQYRLMYWKVDSRWELYEI